MSNISEKVHTNRNLKRSGLGQKLLRCRWDDNIKADLEVLVLEGVDCNL